MPESAITEKNRDETFVAVQGQVSFPVGFKFQQNDDLQFGTMEGETFTPLLLNIDYVVTGAGNDNGGTISLKSGATDGTRYRVRGAAKHSLTKKLVGARYSPETTNSLFERCLIWIFEQVRDVAAISSEFSNLKTNTWPQFLQDMVYPARDAAISARDGAMDARTEALAARDTANLKADQTEQDSTKTAADRLAVAGDKSSIEVAKGVVLSARDTVNIKAAEVATNTATAQQAAANAEAAKVVTETKATEAAGSAADAINAKAQVAAVRDQTLAAFADFEDVYLGAHSTPPTTDKDGSPLDGGELYLDENTNAMKVFASGAWRSAYVSAEGVLMAAANLSDLTDSGQARTNLDVHSKNEIAVLLLGKANADHNHDAAYLGKTAQAADAAKLGGHAPSAGHDPDTITLRDAAGYIFAKLFRSTKNNYDTIPDEAGVLMRGDPVSNNYLRTITAPGFLAWLEANNVLAAYAKTADLPSGGISGLRVSAAVFGGDGAGRPTFTVPAGGVVSSVAPYGSNNTRLYYRWLQINVGGTWVNVGT